MTGRPDGGGALGTAAGVEIADPAEESASSVGAPMEVLAPVVVAAARDCVHTGVHRGARQRAWT